MAVIFETATAREHAYLVERGVRPLALVGSCEARPHMMERAEAALVAFASDAALPFVIDRGDGFAEFGYAAAPWVSELYGWAVRKQETDDAARHRECIVGLLLGYSVRAISDFEGAHAGLTSVLPA